MHASYPRSATFAAQNPASRLRSSTEFLYPSPNCDPSAKIKAGDKVIGPSQQKGGWEGLAQGAARGTPGAAGALLNRAKTAAHDAVDEALPNPAKLATGTARTVWGSAQAVSGNAKLLAAGGLSATGIGAPAGILTAGWGTYNLIGSQKNINAGAQLFNEAFAEKFSDAKLRNFVGFVPSGQFADDVGEPTLLEHWQSKSFTEILTDLSQGSF